MKQILFRGKRIDNNEWVHGFYFESLADGMKHCYIKYETWDEGFVTYEVIPETVGQYTGLKDKNGKKIFEGDILQGTITSTWNKRLIRCEVVYERDCFISVEEDWRSHKLCFAKDIEVIGNIHDNPELLEDMK